MAYLGLNGFFPHQRETVRALYLSRFSPLKSETKKKQKQKQIRDIIKVFTSNNGVVDMITHIHYHATHVQQKRA